MARTSTVRKLEVSLTAEQMAELHARAHALADAKARVEDADARFKAYIEECAIPFDSKASSMVVIEDVQIRAIVTPKYSDDKKKAYFRDEMREIATLEARLKELKAIVDSGLKARARIEADASTSRLEVKIA